MEGLIGFAAFVAAIIMLLRFLRKREIEAFRDADIAVLEEFRASVQASPQTESSVVAGAVAGVAANVVPLPVVPESESFAYELRPALYDDVMRGILARLEQVAGQRYRVMVDVALEDFVHTSDKSEGYRLKNRRVSFLLVTPDTLNLVSGIYLKMSGMASVREADFLAEIFGQLGRPLLQFPLVEHLSEAEIREAIEQSLGPQSHDCGSCGKPMALRKVSRGRRAGQTFWVCPDYPGCNSIEPFKP